MVKMTSGDIKKSHKTDETSHLRSVTLMWLWRRIVTTDRFFVFLNPSKLVAGCGELPDAGDAKSTVYISYSGPMALERSFGGALLIGESDRKRVFEEKTGCRFRRVRGIIHQPSVRLTNFIMKTSLQTLSFFDRPAPTWRLDTDARADSFQSGL